MVIGYDVAEDGTLSEVELTKETLDSTKVVCVIDDETKSIYLWKGSQAGIRRKFIGARVATNLRTEYGFHFKVRPLDEGEEPPTFFSALNGSTAATRVLKPGEAAPPPTPPPSKTTPAKTEEIETTTRTPVTTTTPPPTPPPTKTTSPPPTPPPTTTTTTRPPVSAPPIASQEIDEMIKELETVDPPDGYQRELLIVNNVLYTVAEHKITVFGQEKVERRFEKVKDPPEGTFMAEGFIPRVIVKDGRVLGIELLKGTPDAILSPIKAEMKERLSDLITFFKSEVDEVPEDDGKKGSKKKSKLVAK